MNRRTPLKRHERLSPKRQRPRRSSRVRDEGYMAWIREQECCAAAVVHVSPMTGIKYTAEGGCRGRIHAHHAGRRGLGQKAPDNTCIPLCAEHHAAWHDAQPPFAGWSRGQRSLWAIVQIDKYQAAYAAREAVA